MSYMTLSSQEKITISEKNSLMTPFFTLFVLSRASDNIILLKILGGRMHGPSPHLKFLGGPSPQSPLGFRPWADTILVKYGKNNMGQTQHGPSKWCDFDGPKR